MIKTIICLNFILTISGLLNSNLDQTLVLMNTQNQETAEVINSYVYRMGLAQGDFSYAIAAGLGVSIVSVILLVLANLLTKKLNDRSVLLSLIHIYVFYSLDLFALGGDPAAKFPDESMPLYLYDRNPFNDINYLLNKDVIFEDIPYMLAETFLDDYDEGASYNLSLIHI